MRDLPRHSSIGLIRVRRATRPARSYAAGQFNRQLGGFCALARSRYAWLNWELGNFDASWTARYIHGFDLGSPRRVATRPTARFRTSSWVTVLQLQFGYRIRRSTRIELGVDNVFDKQLADPVQNITNSNTDQ